MDVKNLLGFPVQLGDGRMIGAAGTDSDTRKYGKKQLTERDQNRFRNGQLQIGDEVYLDSSDKKPLPIVESNTKKAKAGENSSDGKKTKTGDDN